MRLETMLRVYFLQNWYALSDPIAEETLFGSEAMRRVAGIEFGDDRVRDATHHLLHLPSSGAARADREALCRGERASGRHGHYAALGHAEGCDNHRRALIDEEQGRDARPPKMSSAKKGNCWFFGMKARMDVDADSGVTHSLDTSNARSTTARSGPTRAMSTPSARPRSSGRARFGVPCARRLGHCTRSTRIPIASSRWCGQRSSIRSGDQTSVWPCEGQLLRPRQERGPALHAVRARYPGRDGEVRSFGEIGSDAASVRRLVRKLERPGARLRFCYEAGPTGYGLKRLIETLGRECAVIAPSLIPRRPGERVKTNRRDAVKLARLFRR